MMRVGRIGMLASFAALSVLFVSPAAESAPGSRGPVLHEPVPEIAGDELTRTNPRSADANRDGTGNGNNGNGEPGSPGDKRDKQPLASYSGKREPQHSTFRPDRDTRRPDTLTYDEPFTPSTAPFKRLTAYDKVDASYTLSVNDPMLRRLLPVSGTASANEDRFTGDMVVELTASEKVRIPSVGPGTRVRRVRATMGTREVAVRMWSDAAENWFVEGSETGSVRLVLDLSIDKRTFGGPFADPEWQALPTVSVPEKVAQKAAKVHAAIGVSREERPREAITKLVAYFRNFVDSNELPDASKDIYLDLALSRKGVCRHRSFAFFVTATALGIPTRMITNEAHAWVEVFDGATWKRIDLGGAGRMLRSDADRTQAHRPAFDPFSWPASATRGQDLAQRVSPSSSTPADGDPNGAQQPGEPGGGPGDGGPGSRTASSAGPNGSNSSATRDEREEDAPPDDKRVAILDNADLSAKRGGNLHVHGRVMLSRAAAAGVVDVVLAGKSGSFVIGQVSASESGVFDGDVYMPQKIPVGPYSIGARVHREGTSAPVSR